MADPSNISQLCLSGKPSLPRQGYGRHRQKLSPSIQFHVAEFWTVRSHDPAAHPNAAILEHSVNILFSQSPPPQLAYRVIREYIVDNRVSSHGLSSPRHRQQHGVQDASNLTCSEYTVHGIFAKLPGFRTFRRFENSRNVEVPLLVFVPRTF